MSERNDGGPAFPRDHAYNGHNGMTLRDYFAAKAMAAILARTVTVSIEPELFAKESALAYAAADAMLKARQA